MVLGSATPASAQPISGSGCSEATTDCENRVDCGTNELNDPCACGPRLEGGLACIQTGSEYNPDPQCCDADEDCPTGWICIDFENTVNCGPGSNPCDGPFAFCFPPCGTLPPT
jgi:hypothetical protein